MATLIHYSGRRGHRLTLRLAVGITFAAAFAVTLLSYLAEPSAGQPMPDLVDFQTISHNARPVAGQVFEGLAIINRSGLVGTAERFSYVHCDGEIAGKRLPARKRFFGEPRRGYTQVVVCSWQIPPDAGGKTLRLWDYGLGRFEHRASVQLGDTNEGSPEVTWGVQKR